MRMPIGSLNNSGGAPLGAARTTGWSDFSAAGSLPTRSSPEAERGPIVNVDWFAPAFDTASGRGSSPTAGPEIDSAYDSTGSRRSPSVAVHYVAMHSTNASSGTVIEF